MRIMITGGAGHIGTALARMLVKDNEVILYDNLTRNTLQHTNLLDSAKVKLIEGDILDYELLKNSMKGANCVIHTAAIAGIDSVIKDPVHTMTVNMIGTANVYKAALENQVNERILDFSTSEVFGSMAYRVDETAHASSGSAGEARWIYAISKLAGEHLGLAYYKQHNLPVTIIRPFNIYGPGQTGEGAIQKFITRALKNETLYINGEGTQIRAWCYIDDFVIGVMQALKSNKAIGESFNIGNPRAVITTYGLAQTVCRVLNSKSEIVFQKQLSADVELRIPNIHKAQKILGYRADVDLEEGIRKSAEWYSQL